MALSFAPRAVLPERRAEGAIVVPGREPVPTGETTTVPDAPSQKRRRDLSVATKNEIIN